MGSAGAALALDIVLRRRREARTSGAVAGG
jgi:hypothetical protein